MIMDQQCTATCKSSISRQSNPTENSIEFFLNTHLEWSLSHQDLVIIGKTVLSLRRESLSQMGLQEVSVILLHRLATIDQQHRADSERTSYEPARYRGQVSGKNTSFVQAVYPLSLTDSEVPFTARAHYPRCFRVLCLLARMIRE